MKTCKIYKFITNLRVSKTAMTLLGKKTALAVVLITFLAVGFIAACGSNNVSQSAPKQSPPSAPQKNDSTDPETRLTGSWQYSTSFGSLTWTFSQDHTWVVTGSSMDGTGNATGQWQISDNKLLTTTKTSTGIFKEDYAVGVTDSDEIIKLDGSVLIVKNGEQQMITFNRN